jgi:lipopolysaccharide/colanic/teichoic acid biosynthesis glycosyltransferase
MIRILDIFFSLFAITLFFPFLLVIVIILKFSGEGEIFYLQPRVGKHGNLFNIFKFATMLKDSPSMSLGTITIKNDPRVLPMGKFLRKTKINELPQLINILVGDMSIIGPRPQALNSFNKFSRSIQKLLIKASPGLSGIGSIIFRNEEDLLNNASNAHLFYKNVIAPYKGNLERWYVENKNIYIYLLLIFLTVWVVFFPKSKLPWKVLNLPKPSTKLKKLLI